MPIQCRHLLLLSCLPKTPSRRGRHGGNRCRLARSLTYFLSKPCLFAVSACWSNPLGVGHVVGPFRSQGNRLCTRHILSRYVVARWMPLRTSEYTVQGNGQKAVETGLLSAGQWHSLGCGLLCRWLEASRLPPAQQLSLLLTSVQQLCLLPTHWYGQRS